VDVYYVRNYYTIIFDVDGGIGDPEQIYAKYGSTYTRPSTDPTKSGYTFGGWFNRDANRWLSSYLTGGRATVTENIVFTASWTQNASSTVTVRYYGQEANNDGFDILHITTFAQTVGSQIGANEQSVKNALANSGVNLSDYDTSFYYNNPSYNQSQTRPITIQADASQNVLNVYLKRKTATYTFRDHRDTKTYGTITAKVGQDISLRYNAIRNLVQSEIGDFAWADYPNLGLPFSFTMDFYMMFDRSATYYATPIAVSGSSNTPYYIVWRNANGVEEKRETHLLPGTYRYYSPGSLYTFSGYDWSKYQGWWSDDGSAVTLTGNDLKNSGGRDLVINNATYEYTRNSNYTAYIVSGEKTYSVNGISYGAHLTGSDLDPLRNQGIIGNVTGSTGGWANGLTNKAKPANMPEGSLFAGWFLDPNFQNSVSLMDIVVNGNITVYAKWVEPSYTVKTYTNSSLSGTPINTQTITYGGIATVQSAPIQAGKKFEGWFYNENGQEKAFSFSLPITKNYNLYPKYSNQVEVGYTVKYLEQGTNRVLATETTGTALIGNPLTVAALTNSQLNLANSTQKPYYYPDETSKTITLNQDETQNVITFYYSKPNPVSYSVRYVEVDNQGNELKVLGQSGVKHTTDAVVTEIYQIFDGYRPQQYSIDFTLTSDASKNVITFKYTAISEGDSTIECQYLVSIPSGIIFTENNLSQAIEISLVSDNEVQLPDNLNVTITASSANNAHLLSRSGSTALTSIQAPYSIAWGNGQTLNVQNATNVLVATFAFTSGANTGQILELSQTGTATLPSDSATMLKTAKRGTIFADTVTFYVRDDTPS